MTCINIDSEEYRLLEDIVGTSLSKFKLHAFAQDFYNKMNRLPKPHEIPGANTEEYVADKLGLSKDSLPTTSAQKIMEFAGTDTVDAAIPVLNNRFTDLKIDYAYDENHKPIIMADNSVAIHIEHKPSRWNSYFDAADFPVDAAYLESQNKNVLRGVMRELGRVYGIKVFYGSSAEIEQRLGDLFAKGEEAKEKRRQLIPQDALTAKGFILEDNIYINSDIAGMDTPLHELMHLMLGAIKYQDPNLYFNLVNSVDNVDNWDRRTETFGNRTRTDKNEELVVQEWAKYVTGQKSLINDLPNNIKMELLGNIQLILDRALFGRQSAESIKPADLYTHSLSSLIPVLGSAISINTPLGTLAASYDASLPLESIFKPHKHKNKETGEVEETNPSAVELASTHRILANKKEALLTGMTDADGNTYKLTEECN